MNIDPDRLLILRKANRLSRRQLADLAEISTSTIKRLEDDPDRRQKTREQTVIGLANALEVEPGVLTGELPLPDSNETPVTEPDPVRVGAQIAPKARLAYDLIKRRYGVNTTDVINMAPLFFSLLAEGSLAWRRSKLEEAKEASGQLNKIDGYWRGGLGTGLDDAVYHGIEREEESIEKADLFGQRLLDDPDSILVDRNFFDLSEENPFADYLRKVADELAAPGFVDVDRGKLDFRSEFRFPYYDVCNDELDRTSNGSLMCRIALQFGFVEFSEIPKELMTKDSAGARQKWIEDKLSEAFKGQNSDNVENVLFRFAALSMGDKTKKMIEERESQSTSSKTDEEGDEV